jgi:hypothetical protein
MKSFVVTLVTWGILFVPLWYGAHELFYPPGDWIGALIASFSITLGIGGLRRARLERRDAVIVARPEGAPRDGERVAIAGTLEPIDAVLEAPLSGAKCVLYDYEISHIPELPSILGKSKSQNSQPSPVIDRSGMAMAPVVIRSGLREVRLLAFPGIEGFSRSSLGEGTLERARGYIAATKFEDQSVFGASKQVSRIMDDRSGCLRVDWKCGSYEQLENSEFVERRVASGAKVCVIGRYSAKDNAIVPQDGVGGTRLIHGTREKALSVVRDKGSGSIIAAVLFIAVPAPIAYGVLTIREQYAAAHNDPTVRGERSEALASAARKGDVAAVRAGVKHGDPNLRNESGYPPLALAPDAATATALLKAGAKVDGRDANGYTPLMLAARDGRIEVIRVLIAHNADIGAKDSSTQRTALDIAIANDQQGAAKFLREAGSPAAR